MKLRFCSQNDTEKTYICDKCHTFVKIPIDTEISECKKCNNYISRFYTNIIKFFMCK